jgi:hypothetical protein
MLENTEVTIQKDNPEKLENTEATIQKRQSGETGNINRTSFSYGNRNGHHNR